jgi:hypothetical protein
MKPLKVKKPRGRPEIPEKDRKSEILHIRVSEEERKKVEAAARKMGLGVADWIREGIIQDL